MKEIFDYLEKTLGIYHNDTHSDNIRKSNDNKIILFDWGRASFEFNPATENGFITNKEKVPNPVENDNDFTKWLSKILKSNGGSISNITLFGGKNKKLKNKNKILKSKKINIKKTQSKRIKNKTLKNKK